MKTRQILIILLLIPVIGFAQNGINYKALIKDDSGNVIANTTVQIQFTIVQDVTNVYIETHSPTTDANGIIIVNIGEGTATSGDFNTINWSEENHSLNVQIDTGNGLVDLGTTQFMSVPYAKHAESATNASNVSGLEAIDEGNGIGWRLVDRNAANYDNIGFNAIDLSFVDDPNLGLGATGNYAFSLGHNGTASGEHALAFGNQNYALNDYAIAIGNNNNVSGLNSTAIGTINQVSGDYAFAVGLQNVASENYAVAIGRNTIASGNSSTAMGNNTEASGGVSTVMGQGATASEFASTAMGFNTNALGPVSTAMGGFTTASGFRSTAMGSGTTASGENSTAMGNNTTASEDTSTAMGFNTDASGLASTAMGNGTEASDFSSTAMGLSTTASGFASTAMGSGTTASESYSTAMGFNTTASGNFSTAMGHSTTASGDNSTAMGRSTNSVSFASTVLGRLNIGGGNSTSWIPTDPLFEIGIGATNFNRSNALTVLKNGNVGIGTNTPQELLHISGGRLSIGNETIEDTGSNQLSVDASLIPNTNDAFRLGNASNRWIGVWTINGVFTTSDRRSKTNIVNLNYGLEDVMKLNPVSFNWKKSPNDDTKLGLIAQDLLKVIPEVVKTHNWETDENGNKTKKESERMGVNYSDLIPVLIKAIQEQQEIIKNYQSEVSSLQSTVNTQDSKIEALSSLYKRMEALEALLITKNEDVKVVSSRQ